jgi:hypothetical protein
MACCIKVTLIACELNMMLPGAQQNRNPDPEPRVNASIECAALLRCISLRSLSFYKIRYLT